MPGGEKMNDLVSKLSKEQQFKLLDTVKDEAVLEKLVKGLYSTSRFVTDGHRVDNNPPNGELHIAGKYIKREEFIEKYARFIEKEKKTLDDDAKMFGLFIDNGLITSAKELAEKRLMKQKDNFEQLCKDLWNVYKNSSDIRATLEFVRYFLGNDVALLEDRALHFLKAQSGYADSLGSIIEYLGKERAAELYLEALKTGEAPYTAPESKGVLDIHLLADQLICILDKALGTRLTYYAVREKNGKGPWFEEWAQYSIKSNQYCTVRYAFDLYKNLSLKDVDSIENYMFAYIKQYVKRTGGLPISGIYQGYHRSETPSYEHLSVWDIPGLLSPEHCQKIFEELFTVLIRSTIDLEQLKYREDYIRKAIPLKQRLSLIDTLLKEKNVFVKEKIWLSVAEIEKNLEEANKTKDEGLTEIVNQIIEKTFEHISDPKLKKKFASKYLRENYSAAIKKCMVSAKASKDFDLVDDQELLAYYRATEDKQHIGKYIRAKLLHEKWISQSSLSFYVTAGMVPKGFLKGAVGIAKALADIDEYDDDYDGEYDDEDFSVDHVNIIKYVLDDKVSEAAVIAIKIESIMAYMGKKKITQAQMDLCIELAKEYDLKDHLKVLELI